MATSTATNAQDTEEASYISDQKMVFRSNQAPILTGMPKKMAAKARLKARKNTPAPPTKGNGRKRLDLSPLPEDKQLRKRIDFGAADNLVMEAPKCKGSIFPPPSIDGEAPPESGKVAGDEVSAAPVDDYNRFKLQSKMDVPSNANEVVVGELVNLPKKELKTNLLLERGLEANQIEGSHGDIAVTTPIQPKYDTILQLASLTSAESLDTFVAQPLLAGSPPEVGHLAVVLHGNHPPPAETAMPPHSASYVLPLDEFPPLGKGRTLKIRDSFETSAVKHGKGSAWPRLTGGTQEPRDTTPPVYNLEDTPAFGAGASAVSADPNIAGDHNPEPRTTNESRTKVDPLGKPTSMLIDGMPSVARDGINKASNNPNGTGGTAENMGHAGKPRSMADVLRESPNPNGPQVFVPEKIQNIGFASLSNGIPAIYFSGSEIQKLADNVGHAIVGKFSHSIPASHQIQKALDNIKFGRSYSWKYINAKHILVQFEDIVDYARMLNGPKGTPVWYIDRHPMRVFKWTPDFDAYCESPIAAIWCNLIGLPIHLFDQSALFAIGKLLGTPIQVDRATADKSRLSFARLCIEIDITKPPPEEIILDICGRETVQQVRWGKIPQYCRECKHVGHSSEVCYAAGKMERPVKRNYNIATPQQKQNGDQGGKGRQNQEHQKPRDPEKGQQGKNSGQGKQKGGTRSADVADHGAFTNPRTKGKETKEPAWEGPDVMGELQDEFGGEAEPHERRGDRNNVRAFENPSGFNVATNLHFCGPSSHTRDSHLARRGTFYNGRGGPRGGGRPQSVGGRGNATSDNYLSSNKYYSLMANGEFDVDGYGESEASGMEVQHDPGADAVIPSSTEGMDNFQVTEFQGGTSSSPGMILPC